MRIKLLKLEKLSGNAASIYSVFMEDEKVTLFDKFVQECSISFKDETKDILKRLITIGHKTGARKQFFKEREGVSR